MKNRILDLQNITYGYSGRPLILNNLNFSLGDGDKVGILAPNGSGKTTLFLLIMGLIKPITGELEIFGKTRKHERDFLEVRRKIGLLFQDSDDQLFCPTVIDDVAFGPLNLNESKDNAMKIARSTLKFLGIEALENRLTYELSGGEKQMVSLATILSMKPKTLLLDEPSSYLDIKTKRKLISVLKTLNMSYIIVSHEFDLLSKTTSNILTIKDGRITADPNLHVHFHKHIHHMGIQPHEHNRACD